MNNRDARILRRLLEIEGGFSDHPDDRGGATNFGFTREALKTLNYKKENPEELTVEEAKDLYYRGYMLPNKYDQIKDFDIACRMLDLAVHTSGPLRSVRANRFLQRAVNDFRIGEDKITVDGIVGPQTLGAVNDFPHPDRIVKSLVIQQGDLYRRIANADESQKVFLGGWFRRLEI